MQLRGWTSAGSLRNSSQAPCKCQPYWHHSENQKYVQHPSPHESPPSVRMLCCCLGAHSCPTMRPYSPPGSSVHGILQARRLEWVAMPFFRGSSQPRIEPRSPALQADSLPAEPQGKPKNTGAGSLSLLQQIFLTQESKQSLLHCRQIFNQLSYQGSPLGKCLFKSFALFF